MWLDLAKLLLAVVNQIMTHVNHKKLVDKGKLDEVVKQQTEINRRIAIAYRNANADLPDDLLLPPKKRRGE